MKDKTLAILKQARPQLIAHLQRHAPAVDTHDLTISLYHAQGRSRSTYLLHSSGGDYILSVHSPETRSALELQHGYKQHLTALGVPVVPQIGPFFEVPGIATACEITRFCPGKNFESLDELNPKQLQHYTDFLVANHKAPRYQPPRHLAPGKTVDAKYPHNFLHYDIAPWNLLYDEQDNIVGLIDFEHCREGRLASDIIGNLDRDLKTQCDANGSPTAHLTDNACHFLQQYQAQRPMQADERRYFERSLCRIARERFETAYQQQGGDITAPAFMAAMDKTIAGMHQQLATALPPHRPILHQLKNFGNSFQSRIESKQPRRDSGEVHPSFHAR